jgi:CubicO group peptidase (beta-lactamase class C family)
MKNKISSLTQFLPAAARKLPFIFLMLSCLMLAILSMAAAAQPAKSDAQGIPPEGQAQIRAAIQHYVDNATIPGAVIVVARNGKVLFADAEGVMNPETKKPMPTDAVMTVLSMSKAYTATSILMLVEKGKINLTDPVSKYIPEFKGAGKVKVPKPGAPPSASPATPGGRAPEPEYDLVPATRDITIQDLLTHTSGVFAGVDAPGIPKIEPGDTLATYIPKTAAIPLNFQPGTKWEYSNALGFDILGRVVEVASGQSLAQFEQQHIFDPLGMKDTAFGLGRTDLDARRVVPMRKSANSTGFERAPAITNPRIVGDTYFSSSAGISTTAEDYARFTSMLCDGGKGNGKHLLKEKTIQLMTANHIGDLFPSFQGISNHGSHFGLSVVVIDDPAAAGVNVPAGSFGWSGGGTHRFWVSPNEKITMVLFVPNNGAPIHRDVEKAVYGAVK